MCKRIEIEYGTSIVTEETGGEERSYEEKIAILHIPESYMSSFEVTASALEGEEYLTVISLKSPYFLNRYTRDFQKQGDEMVLYLGGFRTTFLKINHFPQIRWLIAWNLKRLIRLLIFMKTEQRQYCGRMKNKIYYNK